LLRKRKDTDRQKQGSVGAHLREQLLLESTNLDGRERQDGTELPGPFTIQAHAPLAVHTHAALTGPEQGFLRAQMLADGDPTGGGKQRDGVEKLS